MQKNSDLQIPIIWYNRGARISYIFYFFTFLFMIQTLFSFQVKPTVITKEIIGFENKKKDIISIVIIVLYFIASQVVAYVLLPEFYIATLSSVSLIR